jgi:hypothetical protein
LNPHDRLRSADFKSAVSADFTIRASEEQENSLSLILLHATSCRLRNLSETHCV